MATECLGREDVATRYGAVVQPAISKRLIGVKVHTQVHAVLQHAVPRAIARPGQDPIDATLGDGNDGPTAADTHVDP